MVKFIKFLVVILFGYVLTNFLFIGLMSKIDWEFLKTREAHNFRGQKLEVLVFGNSTAMDGVNTEILSDHLGQSYNFSIGGASLETNYVQFINYLNKNEIPKRVLVFLSSSHICYAPNSEVHPIVNYYYGDYGFRTLADIPLYKFRWLFVENSKKLLSNAHRKATIYKGQLRINRIIPDNSSKNKSPKRFENTLYQESGYNSMWKIIKECQKRGIVIQLFEMPCWREYQNDCPDIMISKDSLHNPKIEVFNLNSLSRCDSLLDGKKDWLSKNHLNYSGSIKISNEIVRLVTADSTFQGIRVLK
jgi:hypothetical protein